METGVLVVDGQPTARMGVRAALERGGDLTVVGETGDTDEALCLAGELSPDLVLSEVTVGGEMSGVRLCRDLKGMGDPPRVVFHAGRSSHLVACSCLLAGADGFVHKGEEPGRLAEAVREVAGGKRVWLLGRGTEEAAPEHADIPGDPLTGKETEVLSLVLEGCSNAEAAERLCLSCSTVKTHLGGVYRKLGVSGRGDLLSARGAVVPGLGPNGSGGC